jgi:hypothetical protein
MYLEAFIETLKLIKVYKSFPDPSLHRTTSALPELGSICFVTTE